MGFEVALLTVGMMVLGEQKMKASSNLERAHYEKAPENYVPPIEIVSPPVKPQPKAVQAKSIQPKATQPKAVQAKSTQPKQPQASSTPLGKFKVTAYCACTICCGKGAKGITKSGDVATEGITVGADVDVLPLGTEIHIEGYGFREVQDTGGGIQSKELDLFFESHQKALEFGVRYLNVSIEK